MSFTCEFVIVVSLLKILYNSLVCLIWCVFVNVNMKNDGL